MTSRSPSAAWPPELLAPWLHELRRLPDTPAAADDGGTPLTPGNSGIAPNNPPKETK